MINVKISMDYDIMTRLVLFLFIVSTRGYVIFLTRTTGPDMNAVGIHLR